MKGRKRKKRNPEIVVKENETQYGKFVFVSPRENASFDIYVRMGPHLRMDPPPGPDKFRNFLCTEKAGILSNQLQELALAY